MVMFEWILCMKHLCADWGCLEGWAAVAAGCSGGFVLTCAWLQVGAHYLKDLFEMFVAEPFKVRGLPL